MRTPRYKLIDPNNSTKYYHCICRCVRRAFLCGYDRTTNKDYNYRKSIIKNLMKKMVQNFTIEICSYVVMSNHIHFVFYVNKEKASSLSSKELLKRWSNVYPVAASKINSMLIQNEAQEVVNQKLEDIRYNLSNISSFMGFFCKYLAQKFNKEDNCKGRFWEGRFKSQALSDYESLINAMVYVDLNPIRAKMVKYPEGYNFSSFADRYYKVLQEIKNNNINIKYIEKYINKLAQPNYLIELKSSSKKILESSNSNINISILDYFNLVDTKGRIVKLNKKGVMSEKITSFINRLTC